MWHNYFCHGSCTAFLLILHFCAQQYIGYALVYSISLSCQNAACFLVTLPVKQVLSEGSSLCTALTWWVKRVYIFLQNMHCRAGRSDLFLSVVHFADNLVSIVIVLSLRSAGDGLAVLATLFCPEYFGRINVIVSGSTSRCVRIQLSPVTRHPAFAGMDLSPLKIPLNAPVYYQNFQELYYSFITTTTMATETPKTR